jgi:8-oxo-dGTP pyrophosphatase MutT (NUDIX family)
VVSTPRTVPLRQAPPFPRLDPAWLRERFAKPRSLEPVARSDSALIPAKLRNAAVLVPVVARPEGLRVLFTRRTDHLHAHAGQISFPGGGAEEGDGSPEATALRETREEIGLEGSRVELLGRLGEYRTVTGYRVTPVVGLVHPPFQLVPDAFEVAEVFEVPLAFLLDPANHRLEAMKRDGRTRRYYAMPYGHYYIWGATAGMLMNLYAFLASQ